MASEAIELQQVYGTWRLVSATAVDAAGRTASAPYGPVPMGRLVLSPTGRMMAVICDGRPVMPDGVRRGYASYCGNFRIDNNFLITAVDAALVPERIGGEQRRRIELRGEHLVLIPPPRGNGEVRELCWSLDGPA